MSAQTAIHSTTQQFLDIYDITSDLLIMKDGAVSLILSVNAINFGLFAEEEQDAVIYAYAGLLNSLNYPIQIVIRSQTKDVTSYLNLLKQQEDETTSQLKKDQIKRYREFVGDLIRERNVLDKKFYVVIPANSLEMGLLPPSTVLPGVKQVDVSTVERSVIVEKARTILEPKRDHIISQFNRIGLFAKQLSTQEIIQLFYISYNPEATEGQQITDTKNYTSPLVSAQFQASAAQLQAVTAMAAVEPTPVVAPTPEPPVATMVAPVEPNVAPIQPMVSNPPPETMPAMTAPPEPMVTPPTVAMPATATPAPTPPAPEPTPPTPVVAPPAPPMPPPAEL